MAEQNVVHAPPPWQLTGNGLIWLFKAAPDWLMAHGFIPESLKSAYVKSMGTAMMVDYHTSDVGPYRELLFIPGRFLLNGKQRYMITKIYVSTMASVVNGRQNWGIPKELADFDLKSQESGAQQISVTKDGQQVMTLAYQLGKIPFPVTTALAPRILKTVVQHKDGQLIRTPVSATGWIRRANIQKSEFNAELFPDLNQTRTLISVHAKPFGMKFHVPEIRPLS